MARNWDYAELSKEVSMSGGPKKYIEKLETASRHSGRMEMLPWIGVTAVGVSFFTAATMKVIDYFKSKNSKNKKITKVAKQETVENIKEYDDAEHEKRR